MGNTDSNDSTQLKTSSTGKFRMVLTPSAVSSLYAPNLYIRQDSQIQNRDRQQQLPQHLEEIPAFPGHQRIQKISMQPNSGKHLQEKEGCNMELFTLSGVSDTDVSSSGYSEGLVARGSGGISDIMCGTKTKRYSKSNHSISEERMPGNSQIQRHSLATASLRLKNEPGNMVDIKNKAFGTKITNAGNMTQPNAVSITEKNRVKTGLNMQSDLNTLQNFRNWNVSKNKDELRKGEVKSVGMLQGATSTNAYMHKHPSDHKLKVNNENISHSNLKINQQWGKGYQPSSVESSNFSDHSVRHPVESSNSSDHSVRLPVESSNFSDHSVRLPVESSDFSVHSVEPDAESSGFSVQSDGLHVESTGFFVQSGSGRYCEEVNFSSESGLSGLPYKNEQMSNDCVQNEVLHNVPAADRLNRNSHKRLHEFETVSVNGNHELDIDVARLKDFFSNVSKDRHQSENRVSNTLMTKEYSAQESPQMEGSVPSDTSFHGNTTIRKSSQTNNIETMIQKDVMRARNENMYNYPVSNQHSGGFAHESSISKQSPGKPFGSLDPTYSVQHFISGPGSQLFSNDTGQFNPQSRSLDISNSMDNSLENQFKSALALNTKSKSDSSHFHVPDRQSGNAQMNRRTDNHLVPNTGRGNTKEHCRTKCNVNSTTSTHAHGNLSDHKAHSHVSPNLAHQNLPCSRKIKTTESSSTLTSDSINHVHHLPKDLVPFPHSSTPNNDLPFPTTTSDKDISANSVPNSKNNNDSYSRGGSKKTYSNFTTKDDVNASQNNNEQRSRVRNFPANNQLAIHPGPKPTLPCPEPDINDNNDNELPYIFNPEAIAAAVRPQQRHWPSLKLDEVEELAAQFLRPNPSLLTVNDDPDNICLYDAYLLVSAEDVNEFAIPFLALLESWNLRIFFTKRNLLASGPFFENISNIVKKRCNGKLIAVVSNSYPSSDECKFLTAYVKTLDPDAKLRNIIPLYIDKNIQGLPEILTGLSSIRYNQSVVRGFLQQKILSALDIEC